MKKVLSAGDVGDDVAAVHKLLDAHGFTVPAAEAERQFFGPGTRTAVADFQRSKGIQETREVGNETEHLLVSQPPANADIKTMAAVASGLNAVATAPASTFGPTEKATIPSPFGPTTPTPTPHNVPTPTGADHQVTGRILLDHGLPADGVALRFYHKDFGAEVQLGETRTDGQGLYALPYNAGDKTINLEVRAVDPEGKEIPLSDTKFNAAREEALNLVAPATVQPLAAEYHRLSTDLGKQIGDLSKLAGARETGERQDLTVLNQSTGWDARLIALAANATRIGSETGIPQEALYGLYRAGLPTDVEQLVQLSVGMVEQALGKVKEAGIVSLSDEQVSQAKTAFANFARTTRLIMKAPGGSSTFSALLNVAGSTEASKLNESEKNTFADLYFAHNGSAGELWQKAREQGISETKINALQLQGKLSYLTLNNAELASSLQSEIGSTAHLDQLVEKDLYKEDAWKSRLSEKTVPPAYDGGVDSYAADLARKVRLSFPSKVVARMVEKDELHLGDNHEALKTPVSTFLNNAVSQGFELGRVPLATFIKENSAAVFKGIAQSDVEATTQNVERLHRLYQITPSNEALGTVMELGFNSAHDITDYSYGDFIDRFGDRFRTRHDAELIYRKSEQVTTVIHNFFTAAKQLETAAPIYAVSGPAAARENTKNELIKHYPTMESLFGSLDFCECEHCRSVLSPAAYLVDLLQFLDPKESVWKSTVEDWRMKHKGVPYPFRDEPAQNRFLETWRKAHPGQPDPDTQKKPYDVLIERRPDLPHLSLDCENTNTVLPYIDIANEILEYYVAKEKLDELAVHDTGTATTAELLAEPQNVTPAAYNKLKEARYPVNLPFDLWLETVRQFFQQSETPLWQVLELLRPSDELFPPPANPKPYYRAAIFAEYLGISPAEYAIFTSPNPLANWFELYGYANDADALAALQSAKTLSRQLGITYRELVQLVQTAFVNPRLDALIILRKLQLDAKDMLQYKGQAGHPELPEVEKTAFEKRLSDLGESVELSLTEMKKRLDTAWNNTPLNEILLLADPDTGCNFDLTRLRYADNNPADGLAFLKLNIFVRLWKKLGWSIEETDRAVQVFLPSSSLPLTGVNLGAAMTSSLVYIAHLKALSERISVGKNRRLKLSTFWSNIPATGKNPLYAQLFLKRSILKNDAVFDDPFGNYLSKPGLFLKDHALAIQSALNLTADEMEHILADVGHHFNTAPLSLENVSALYRYGLLAKALKLSVRDLITLKGLSGLDPFKPLSPAPVAAIAEDYPFTQTLEFVAVAEKVKESGFRVDDLDYLLRHSFDPVGRYRPSTQGSLALVKTLAAGIRRIQIEQAVPEDAAAFTDDMLRQKLASLFPADVAEAFFSMWAGTKEYEALVPVLPGDKLNPETFSEEPAIRVSYDDMTQQQRLTIRGVLVDARKAELKTKFPSILVGKLLDDAQDQARSFFQKYLAKSAAAKPFAGFLQAGDFELLFAPIPDTTSDQEKQNLLRGKREKLATAFLPFLQQRLIRQFVLQTLTANLGADAELIETLVTRADLLGDPKEPGKSLLDAFARTGESGVTASFFASADGTGPLLIPTTSASNVDTTGKPAAANSSLFQGYLEVPASGAYRFFIVFGKKDAKAELRFHHLSDPLLRGVAVADGAEISQFTELKAGVPYGFSLGSNNAGGEVALFVLGQDMPRGSLSRLVLYPQEVVERVDRAWILLSKILQLIQGFALSEREVRHLLSNTADFGNLDLSKIPTRESDDSPTGAISLFAGFIRLADLAQFKRNLGETTDDLIGVFENARRSYPSTADISQSKSALLDDLYGRMAVITRRAVATLRAISESLDITVEQSTVGNELRLSVPAFTSERGIIRLWEVLQVVEKLGVPAEAIVRWATPSPNSAIARDLKDTVKARYEPENWQRIAQPIFDKLRQRQRDALVAYVIHRHGFERVEQLFEYFLIDPGMEPVVQTSRLRLAISSVQLFIQRCLLNLEPKVHPSVIDGKHWQWMKRYRVWEANRKIFLFPENWLEPEFRDDKTFLFQELESALLQGDVSNDLVEDAFFKYLKKLEEIARLDIVAMYCDKKPDPDSNVLYVLGRTHALPHRYFYRRYAHQMWSPWEQVSAEIEGDHVAIVLWRERLHLFWLNFLEKVIPDPNSQQSSSDTAHLADMTFNNLASRVAAGNPRKQVDVQLSWSELFQGQWTPRRSSEFMSLDPRTLPSFNMNKVFMYPYKEYDQEGQERAVRINLSGDIFGAFRVVSKNCQPQPIASVLTFGIPYWGGTERLPHATQFTSSGALKVSFSEEIKIVDEKSPEFKQATKEILRRGEGGGYSLLACNDLSAVDQAILFSLFHPDGPKAKENLNWWLNEFMPSVLTGPFFYQDDQHTFFAEPTLTETTIDRWEEWVIPPPKIEKQWEAPAHWETIPIVASVPLVPRDPRLVAVGPPSVVDPIARFKLQQKADWATNPATLFRFGDRLITSGGGFSSASLAVTDVSGSGVVAAPAERATELAGTSVAETNLLSLAPTHSELTIVGGGGLNAAKLQAVKSQLNSTTVRNLVGGRNI
jgi:hypothetical protein